MMAKNMSLPKRKLNLIANAKQKTNANYRCHFQHKLPPMMQMQNSYANAELLKKTNKLMMPILKQQTKCAN